MKLLKIPIVFATLVVIFGASSYSHAAEVRSMSRPFTSVENGVKVTSVSVTCAEVDQPRIIVKFGKSKKWCAQELATLCNKQKVATAKKVCDTHFDELVLASKSGDSPETEKAMVPEPELDDATKAESIVQQDSVKPSAVSEAKQQAKLKYEEEQALIEQKLLEIRRRQAEITEQASELRARQDSGDVTSLTVSKPK